MNTESLLRVPTVDMSCETNSQYLVGNDVARFWLGKYVMVPGGSGNTIA